MKRKILFLCIFFILLSYTASAQITAIDVEKNTNVSQDVTVTYYNTSNVSNPDLFYKKPHDPRWYEEENISQEFILNGSEIERQGPFQFYIETSSQRFPKNATKTVFINNELGEYGQDHLQFLKTNPSGEPGDPCSNYDPLDQNTSCQEDIYNAAGMNRLSKLYDATDNESYKKRVHNISQAWNYSCKSGEDITCGEVDLDRDEYLSSTYNLANTILYLWEAYERTGVEELRDLAINYSKGNSEDCDLSSDYRCTASSSESGPIHDQGLIIMAMLESYKKTGDDIFENRLKNLVDEDFSQTNPIYAKALLEASEVLEKKRSEAITEVNTTLQDCDGASCENLETDTRLGFSILSIDETLNLSEDLVYDGERFIFDAFNETEFYCDGDYDCVRPFDQLNHARLAENIEYRIAHKGDGFYNFRYEKAKEGGDLNVSIQKKGFLDKPKIYYKDPVVDDVFKSKLIENETVNISDGSENSGALKIYFEDEKGNRYPKKNFTVPVPININELEQDTHDLTFNNPQDFCSPFDGDHSCRYEFQQGIYLEGLSHTKYNVTDEIQGLGSSEIDPIGEYSTCDPYENDYTCEAEAENRRIIKPGVKRKANLIKGYVEMYKKTGNDAILDDAITLAYEPAEECDLSKDDFTCGNSSTQGEITDALLRLYQVTGDQTLLNWSNNLLDNINNNTRSLILTYLNNYHFIEDIDNDINTYIKSGLECEEDDECSIEQLYEENEIIWKAYNILNNETFFERGTETITLSPESPENLCDPSAGESFEDRYQCESPGDQGKAIKSYSTALNNYVLREPPEVNLTIRGPTEGSLHEEVAINCTVKNVGNRSLASENLVFSTAQDVKNISTSPTYEQDGTTVNIEDLDVGERANISYTLNLTTGGISENLCSLAPTEDSAEITVSDLGNVLQFNLPQNANTFNDHTFTLNITNEESFLLEDINITTNLSKKPKNVSINQSYNESIYLDLLGEEESYLLNLTYPKNTSDQIDMTFNATTAYGGKGSISKTTIVVENDLKTSVDVDEPHLFNSFNYTIEIKNDHPFNITDLKSDLNFDNNTFNIRNRSPSSQVLNITEGNVSNMTYTLRPEEGGASYKNLSANLFATQGFNLSTMTDTVFVNDSIINIETDDKQVSLNTPITNDIITSFDGERNLTNIDFTIEFNESRLNVTDLKIENITNIINKSIDANYTVENETNESFSPAKIGKNDSVTIKPNTSQINNTTTLDIYSTYKIVNGTNQTPGLQIEYANRSETCSFLCTLPTNISLPEISIHPNNKTLNLTSLEVNQSIENVTFLGKETQNGFTLYNMSPSQEIEIQKDLQILKTPAQYNIQAESEQGALGSTSVRYTEKDEESSGSQGGSSESSSSTALPPSPSDEKNGSDQNKSISLPIRETKLPFEELLDPSMLQKYTFEPLNETCLSLSYEIRPGNRTAYNLTLNNGCINLSNVFIVLNTSGNLNQYRLQNLTSEHVLQTANSTKNISSLLSDLEKVQYSAYGYQEKKGIQMPQSYIPAFNSSFLIYTLSILFFAILITGGFFLYLEKKAERTNFYKLFVPILKGYHALKNRLVSNNKRIKIGVGEKEDLLHSLLMKTVLIEKHAKKKNLTYALEEIDSLINLYSTKKKELHEADDEIISDKAEILSYRIEDVVQKIERLKKEKQKEQKKEKKSPNEKDEKRKKHKEKEKTEEDDEETIHHDLYCEILKVENLAKEKNFEKAYDRIEKIKEQVDDLEGMLDEEKDFLDEKINQVKGEVDRRAESSQSKGFKQKLQNLKKVFMNK